MAGQRSRAPGRLPVDPVPYDPVAAAFSLIMTILERLDADERERVMERACLWAGIG